MPLTKSGKRILLIAGAVVLVVGGAATAYTIRRSRLDRQAIEAGEAARVAFEKGDYPAALEGMTAYMQRFQGRTMTAADYRLLARARRKVEAPDGSHLVAATALLRRAVTLDPADLAAKAELRDLYLETGFATEALELIDSMLRTNPADVESLKAKFDVLAALRQFAKAREVGKELVKAAPADLEYHLRTLDMMIASDVAPADIDAWTEATIAARSQDRRFELLRAASLAARRDPDSAAKARASLDRVLASVAETQSVDPAYMRFVLVQLDQAERFDDALGALARIDASSDRSLQRELLLRRYYAGRLPEVVAQLDRMGPEKLRSDPEMLALHCVTLAMTGKTDRATEVRGELAAHADGRGRAWTAFADYVFPRGEPDPRALSDSLADAVRVVPDSALLRLALGGARSRLGEPDLAVQAWTDAARLAPSWSSPLRLIAESLMRGTGNEAEALAMAWRAYARAPRDAETIATLIRAIALDPTKLSSQARDRLLASLEQLKAASPATADAILAQHIEIVASADRAEGVRRVRAELGRATPLAQPTLLALAALAGRLDPALRDEVLAACERAHGPTPELALARASSFGRDVRGGLAAIAELKSRAVAGSSELEWGIVRANYLASVGSDEAGGDWIALAEKYPEELRVQLGALAADSVWADKDAVAKIISRVKELSGPNGTTWRIAQARLLLADPSAPKQSLAEAAQSLTAVAQTLPSSVEVRVHLAQALERLDNAPGAEEQLLVAQELSRDNAWIALELARLAQRLGRPDDARRHMDRALASNDLAPALTSKAAYLLAMQGEFGKGASLLAPVQAQAPDRSGTLLLAQLYAKLGNVERALAVCGRLLDDAANAPTLQLAAALHASLGSPEQAEALLSRIDALGLPPGERELLRARHAVRWQTRDVAMSWFRKTVLAAPTRLDAWSEYLEFAADSGDPVAMSEVLDHPAAATAEPVTFAKSNRELLATAIAVPELRAVVIDALRQPAERGAILEALRVVVTDWPDPEKRAASARTIRDLAEKHPKSLSLQVLAANRCAQVGDVRGGCDIARRAMASFPSSPAPAWQAAQLLAASERWADAVDAGLAWRDRSPRGSLEPEVFVAKALMQVQRVPDAAAGLELHLSEAMAEPERHQEFVLTYCAALVRTDRTARAADLLGGLARGSERWRIAAISLHPSLLGDGVRAAQWLAMCASNVPSSDAAARMALAKAWCAAWESYRTDELHQSALTLLGELASSPSTAGEAHLAAGTLLHQSGDLARAEQEYGAAIQSDAGLLGARNNLAVLLADRGEWEKARDQAFQAVQGAPSQPSYHDTLAYAFRKGRQYAKAAECLRTAIRLEPANPVWAVNLADTLSESPEPGAAAELAKTVIQVDEMLARGARLPRELRDKLERARAAKR